MRDKGSNRLTENKQSTSKFAQWANCMY